jgi:hypothetical protein
MNPTPTVILPITTGTRVTIAYNAIDFKTLPEKRQYRVKMSNQAIRQSSNTADRRKKRALTGHPRSLAPIPLQCKR